MKKYNYAGINYWFAKNLTIIDVADEANVMDNVYAFRWNEFKTQAVYSQVEEVEINYDIAGIGDFAIATPTGRLISSPNHAAAKAAIREWKKYCAELIDYKWNEYYADGIDC